MIRRICARRSVNRLLFRSFSDKLDFKNNLPEGTKKYFEVPPAEKPIGMMESNYELRNHSKKVFTHISKFLGTTALTSASTIGLGSFLSAVGPDPTPLLVPAGMIWIGAACGGIYSAFRMEKEEDENEKLMWAYRMHGLMGITITPSVLIFPECVPHALCISTALVAGPTMLALYTPKDKFLSWGVPLTTGLFGLIGIGFSSIGLNLLGFSEMAENLHSVDLYGGVALFTAFSAYDTHKMIKDFEEGEKDAIGHACNYSLNFINLFTRLLEIISKGKKD